MCVSHNYLVNPDALPVSEDHVRITGLRPNQNYTFVVEARKMQKYAGMDECKKI